MASDKEYLILNKRIKSTIQKAKRISIPGFDGVPVFYVVKFFVDGISKGYIAIRASAVAFNFSLAIFPAVMFLFTLIPFLPIKGLNNELLTIAKDILPNNAFSFLESTLVNTITTKNSKVLSFGVFASLLFSTNGIHSLIQAFNNTYHSIETRSWLAIRLVAIQLVFIISVLITTALILITFSHYAMDKLVEMEILQMNITFYLLVTGKWFIIIALFFFAISFLYYYAPAKKTEWKFISAGSTLATILALLTSLGFSYFVNNFGQYNKLFGSIGTMMVILLWLYFNSFALILGFELNASINTAHSNSKYKNDEEKNTGDQE